MIKITDELYVAADSVAAVEMVTMATRDRVRVTMKPGDVHWVDVTPGVANPTTELRAQMNNIITRIDEQLTIMHGGET